MVVSVGIGSMRKWSGGSPLPFFLTWVTLTAELPRSRPMQFFAIAASHLSEGRSLTGALLVFFCVAEDHHAIRRLQAEGLEDLPLRIHPRLHAALDTIDGEGRKPRSPRELRLRHHRLRPQLANVVLHLGRFRRARATLRLLVGVVLLGWCEFVFLVRFHRPRRMMGSHPPQRQENIKDT